jgi:hypothetical protein
MEDERNGPLETPVTFIQENQITSSSHSMKGINSLNFVGDMDDCLTKLYDCHTVFILHTFILLFFDVVGLGHRKKWSVYY